MVSFSLTFRCGFWRGNCCMDPTVKIHPFSGSGPGGVRPPPPGWPPSEAGSGLSKMDGWTDGRADGRDGRTYRFPLYSTGLRPLRFPPGPLPCLHNSYHHKIPEQGKGTDDHLLPLGNWFLFLFLFLFSPPESSLVEWLSRTK